MGLQVHITTWAFHLGTMVCTQVFMPSCQGGALWATTPASNGILLSWLGIDILTLTVESLDSQQENNEP